MTPAERRAMADVKARAKGWPVGVPVEERMARSLVAQGYAEWAPPMYLYPKPVFTIRLTGAGEAHLKYGVEETL